MMRILKIILVIAVIGVVLNDGARWAAAVVDLRSSTGRVLDRLAVSARGKDQTTLATMIAQEASVERIRVSQFAVDASTLHLWSEEDVNGTIILGPYTALNHAVPFAKAWSVPFVVKYDAVGPLR